MSDYPDNSEWYESIEINGTTVHLRKDDTIQPTDDFRLLQYVLGQRLQAYALIHHSQMPKKKFAKMLEHVKGLLT